MSKKQPELGDACFVPERLKSRLCTAQRRLDEIAGANPAAFDTLCMVIHNPPPVGLLAAQLWLEEIAKVNDDGAAFNKLCANIGMVARMVARNCRMPQTH